MQRYITLNQYELTALYIVRRKMKIVNVNRIGKYPVPCMRTTLKHS